MSIGKITLDNILIVSYDGYVVNDQNFLSSIPNGSIVFSKDSNNSIVVIKDNNGRIKLIPKIQSDFIQNSILTINNNGDIEQISGCYYDKDDNILIIEKSNIKDGYFVNVYSDNIEVLNFSANNFTSSEIEISDGYVDNIFSNKIITIDLFANNSNILDVNSNKIISTDGYIVNLLSTNIDSNNISTNKLITTDGYITNIFSTNINTNNVFTNNLTTTNSYITNITSESINSNNINTGTLTSTNIYSTTIQSNNISATNNLTSLNSNITNITSTNIKSLNLNTENLNVDNASIASFKLNYSGNINQNYYLPTNNGTQGDILLLGSNNTFLFSNLQNNVLSILNNNLIIVEDSTLTSTTSTSYVPLITINNAVVGARYLLLFNANAYHSNNNILSYFIVGVGANTIPNTEIQQRLGASQLTTSSISTVLVATDSLIRILWRTSANTFYCLRRSLILLRVG